MCDFTFELCGGNPEKNVTSVVGEAKSASTARSWRLVRQPYFYYSFFNCGEDEGKLRNPPLFSSFRLEEHFPLVYLLVSMICQLGLSLYVLRHLVIFFDEVNGQDKGNQLWNSLHLLYPGELFLFQKE